MRFKLVLFFLFFGINARAQYIFNNLQPKDGLHGKDVFCSYKDSEGFMWFGTTTGLNRYDGSNFKLYNKSNKKFPGLKNELVTSIIEYSADKIFIASRAGLFCHFKNVGNFEPISFVNDKDSILNNVRVEKLFKDSSGRLWIATQSGLFIFDKDKAVPVTRFYPKASWLNDKYIPSVTLAFDNIKKGIWSGLSTGLCFLDFKTGEIYSVKNNPGKWTLFDTTAISALSLDRSGTVFFADQVYMLASWKPENNVLTDLTYLRISANGKKDGCNNLFADSKGRLWISGWLGKLSVIEPGGKMIVLPDASPGSYKLPVGFFYQIYEDDKHNLWVAGINGVSRLAADNCIENIYELPGNLSNPFAANASINAMAKLDDNNWLIGKEDGLYVLDLRTGNTKRYTVAKTGIQPNRIFGITLIDGEYWCGAGDGIQIFNPVTKTFRPFTYYPKGHEIKNRSVMWTIKDKKGFIWFAAWADAVYRFDPVTKNCIRFDETILKPEEFGATNCVSSLLAADGKMWLGYGVKGIRIFDNATNHFSKPVVKNNLLDKEVILSICEDREHNIWLATTTKGILKFNKDAVLIDSINADNGLGLNQVEQIGFDEMGRLWATTSEGLYYINPSNKKIAELDVDMGEPFHDPIGVFTICDNKLLATMVNKVALINLAKVGKFSASPEPLVSGISVFEQEAPVPGLKQALQLNYDENFFVIEFSSANHHDISSLEYAYKLEPFDKDWVYCGHRQTASYTNVPSGRYTFLVKCTDANGQWIQKKDPVHIIVKPVFWNTWWFIGIMILLGLFILWKLYQLQIHNNRKNDINKTIDYFANSVYGQNSINEICWDIARNCISQLHFEDCVVYLFDEKRNVLVQKAAYGPKNPKGQEIVAPVEITPGNGIAGVVAATGKPLLIPDTTKDKRYIAQDEKRLSELAVPILHDGEVIGVIDSEHSHKHYFTEAHLKALSTIASISANKIAEAKAEALVKENEIKVLEINKMLAESQLMAMRAQMNPHFVFNCLNSIQECIVTQKYGEASNYLNKFSKLFRMVLNNSGKKLISLEEEKEVLQLYLQLELMRFEKSFTYDITIDEELDINEVLIPSMLLQPYVENALWHGLMHKDGERILHIEFKSISEEVFACIIEDNGIGRKRSFDLKVEQSKTKRHESKGLKISADRLEVIQKQGYHATLQMIDKYDENQQPTGTKIIIELSTELIN